MDWKKPENSYKLYKKMYDYENGTNYARQHYEQYEKQHVETSHDDATDVEQTIKRIDYNDGKQRNIIGNYNDNNVNIEKCFNHLNALKRSMTLSHQTDNENKKLFHENIMFRELLSLELSLRTMKQNIKRENENE